MKYNLILGSPLYQILKNRDKYSGKGQAFLNQYFPQKFRLWQFLLNPRTIIKSTIYSAFYGAVLYMCTLTMMLMLGKEHHLDNDFNPYWLYWLGIGFSIIIVGNLMGIYHNSLRGDSSIVRLSDMLSIGLDLPDNEETRFLTSNQIDFNTLVQVLSDDDKSDNLPAFLSFPMSESERGLRFRQVFEPSQHILTQGDSQ